MRLTELTLLEQLRITERDITRRQELLDFTDEDVQLLVKNKPIIANNIDIIVDEFYIAQVNEEEISRLIGDSETLTRLKKHMRKYILDLFDGQYGPDYVQSRLRIGIVHKRIGVTPKLYISAIRNLEKMLLKYIIFNSEKKSAKSKCVSCSNEIEALQKIILFDLELVFDTYIHSLMEEINRTNYELEHYAQSLEKIVKERTRELEEQARRDSLTGLFNHKSFYSELKRELSRNHRNGDSLVLVYFDLDNFKNVNDTYGHQTGDTLLTAASRSILEVIRESDIPVRYGGDEFCIILPQTNTKGAIQLSERLIECFKRESSEYNVTLSIGLSESNPDIIMDADALIKSADLAMYKSKERNGSHISVYKES